MSNLTYIYPLPELNQSDGIVGLLTYGSDVSGGLLFPMVLLAIFAITFITGLYSTSVGKALTFASFISMVIGIMLAVLDLLAPRYMYLCIVLLAIGVFWVRLEDNG